MDAYLWVHATHATILETGLSPRIVDGALLGIGEDLISEAGVSRA